MHHARASRVPAFLAIVVHLVLACSTSGPPTRIGSPAASDTSAAIDAQDLLAHTVELSSDRYEGRAPGSRGEELTVEYLTKHFRELGLAPGNPDGTYVQRVPLVGFRGQPSFTLELPFGEKTLAFPDQFVALTRRPVDEVNVDAPLVFAGYGVVAPEFGWDDFEDVDVRGKTLVMLVNDPPVPDPSDPAKLDAKVFGGRAMTYYGRWTYKYEIAAQKGAAACILVHETGPAGYPYQVVSGSWGRENFDVASSDGASRVQVEGWITEEVARELFDACGLPFDEAKRKALRRDFRPIPLEGAKARLRVERTAREVVSHNVVARIPGSDPKRKDELVVYTAHWDHLGRDESREGDQIFNGAVDNATGIAGMLEIAEAFTRLDEPPARSVLFLAVTAEEKGLLGAKYYASHPLYPLAKTLAVINMDGLNTWGKTRDVASIGLGNSTLHDVLIAAAREQGRVVVGDSEPEKGYFYRSDHFEFAKRGVPGLHFGNSLDFVDRPAGYGEQKSAEYTERDYHKPSDEVMPDWDLSGAVEDLRLFFDVGLRVCATDEWPRWTKGAEFEAVREASLGTR